MSSVGYALVYMLCRAANSFMPPRLDLAGALCRLGQRQQRLNCTLGITNLLRLHYLPRLCCATALYLGHSQEPRSLG